MDSYNKEMVNSYTLHLFEENAVEYFTVQQYIWFERQLDS